MSNFEEWDIDTLRVRYKELEEENKKYPIKLNDEIYRRVIENAQKEFIPISVIQNKRNEYLDFDKKHKTYTKDGRENFTMEYFKAKALDEILDLKE